MKSTYSHIAALVLLACLSACTERIFLANEGMPPKLVITGIISNMPASHEFYLQNSSGSYFAPAEESMSNPFLGPAEVWLDEEKLTSTGGGHYRTRKDFSTRPGQKYTLTVRCDYDQDGRIEEYKASTTAPRAYTLDSISINSLVSGQNLPGIMMLHYQDSIGKDYIAAYMTINNELYSNRLLRFGFVSNNLFGQDGSYCHVPISNWLINKDLPHDNDTKKPLYRYDELFVEMVMLSAEVYAFYDAARTQLGQSNPLFGARGNLPTNFSGGALGVFGALFQSNAASVILDYPELPEREK